jgi:UDP-2,4-diacetamido-2,4,6-trideoxy-beta-L-altropyranose hydrolase
MNSVSSVPSVAKNLVIRADAGTEIGTGHVMRCLALAQGWQDAGGHAIFAMATEVPNLEGRLKSEGVEVVHLAVKPGSSDDAIATGNLAREIGAAWVVVDGYRFTADYQRRIKDSEMRLLFVDDYGHTDRYYADVVLNQNRHAHEGLYVKREPHTRLLLGTHYALLRREFLRWQGWQREIPPVARRMLVTMGGGDPDNVTLKVILALNQMDLPELEVNVVVGQPAQRACPFSFQLSAFSFGHRHARANGLGGFSHFSRGKYMLGTGIHAVACSAAGRGRQSKLRSRSAGSGWRSG